jgi:acetyltransferase-like isoleucine patch superfamily enzyme
MTLDPSRMSPRARNVAAGLVQRAWAWVSAVGMIGPHDRAARDFARFGAASGIAFPPGPTFGERWISIGDGTLIGPHVSLAAGMGPAERLDAAPGSVIRIGDRCNIGRGSSIVARCGIEIGDDVTTGPGVYITDHNHAYDDVEMPIATQFPVEDPVVIGAGSWLGAGVIVLPGARLGAHVVVAAGAVVRGDVPDRCVVAGVPGRVVRRWVNGSGWVPPVPRRTRPIPPSWPGSNPG